MTQVSDEEDENEESDEEQNIFVELKDLKKGQEGKRWWWKIESHRKVNLMTWLAAQKKEEAKFMTLTFF